MGWSDGIRSTQKQVTVLLMLLMRNIGNAEWAFSQTKLHHSMTKYRFFEYLYAIGYPLGAAVQSGLNSALNPWHRPLFQDLGLTIQQWIQPSVLPGAGGSLIGGLLQEAGNAAVNGQTSLPIPARPTRGGQ
jgi:hypothetical protein